MVAGGKGDDAALALGWRQLQQAVGRSAQLERSAGLQTLAFQPDSDAFNLAFDERRLLDQTLNSLSRGQNVRAGQNRAFS
jgi:hypothetical protein